MQGNLPSGNLVRGEEEVVVEEPNCSPPVLEPTLRSRIELLKTLS